MNLQFYYSNLPIIWEKLNKNDFSISENRYNELCKKLEKLPEKSITIYTQNGCGLFVETLMKNYKVFGINFKDYFENNFKKDEEFSIKKNTDVVFIYNIGLEKALNMDFSKKLLLGLIEELKNNNTHIFLCSHLSYSDFYKSYEIDLVNKISIQKKKEEAFL